MVFIYLFGYPTVSAISYIEFIVLKLFIVEISSVLSTTNLIAVCKSLFISINFVISRLFSSAPNSVFN